VPSAIVINTLLEISINSFLYLIAHLFFKKYQSYFYLETLLLKIAFYKRPKFNRLSPEIIVKLIKKKKNDLNQDVEVL